MIGEAVVEDDDARRTGLLTLADIWADIADHRRDEEADAPPRKPARPEA